MRSVSGSRSAIDDAVVAFAPGLPDDDVAILALRLLEPVGR